MSDTETVMRKLIAIRQGSGLSPTHVAARMSTTPQAVLNIEWRTTTGGRDLQVATLLRYARAIGVQLCYRVVNETNEKDFQV